MTRAPGFHSEGPQTTRTTLYEMHKTALWYNPQRSHLDIHAPIGGDPVSVQHMNMVLEAQGLCAQEKAVLTACCNHTDPSGKTYAGEERLMREAGMPRTTFQRWRAKLVSRGLLFSKRKGRKGGGRTTSDTWVNLEALRAARDPWFDRSPADRDEDENPFSGQDVPAVAQPGRRGKGPVGGAKGRGSNGPASGAINGPVSGACAAPPAEPVTLRNPQGETAPPVGCGPSPTESQRKAAARSALRAPVEPRGARPDRLPFEDRVDHLRPEDPLPVVGTATIPGARGDHGGREETAAQLERERQIHFQQCAYCQRGPRVCQEAADLIEQWSLKPDSSRVPAPF